MSAPTHRVQRVKRVAHYRQQNNWLPLFKQAQEGRACAHIAAEHPGMGERTLQMRYRRWCAAQQAGDALEIAKCEGKVDGRRYSRSALSEVDEEELAARLRSAKGTCQSTTSQYIDEEVSQYTDDQPSALILDDYDCHQTDEVRDTAAAHNVELIIVPPGMTHVLQPLDVGVNAELKRRAREKWVQDKAEGKENADTLSRAAQRINEAYRDLPTSTITGAFKKALPTVDL